MKILALGIGQNNFLTQLYGGIKDQDNSIHFSVNNHYPPSEDFEYYNLDIFDHIYQSNKYIYSKKELFFGAFKVLFYTLFWKFLFYEVRTNKKIKLKSYFIKQVLDFLFCEKIIKKQNYDICQFHYCTSHNLELMKYIPKKVKIICSFWGADLYHHNDIDNVKKVSIYLKRANIVTTHTPKMGELLIKKFGNNLQAKLSFLLFTQSKEIYNYIDKYKTDKEQQQNFKKKLGINQNNIVITVSYRASKFANHLYILPELEKLPSALKKKITVVVPLTYGRDETYIQEVEDHLRSMSIQNIVSIHDYLSQKEIALLRLITDIQIQMIATDALSASVTELMYTGNCLIAADWLPYNIFKDKGLQFGTVNDFDGLPQKLTFLIENLEEYKKQCTGNKSKIENNFFPEHTSQKWRELFYEVTNNTNKK